MRRADAPLVAARSAIAVTILVAASYATPQAPPTFATQAELVTVDVVVLGPDDKPVSGLTQGDFVVKEDGRPQTVTAFEEIRARVPALTAPATAASRSIARVATNAAAPATRRTFAIVFDDLHVGDINIEEAKRAVREFVTRDTVPGDRLVLLTVSDGRYWATSRGAEDATWLEALKMVRSHRRLQERVGCRVTYYEAMQVDLIGNRQVADLVGRRIDALCHNVDPEQLARGAIAAEAARGGVSGSSDGRSVSSDAMLTPTMSEEYARQRGQLLGSLRVLREMVSRLAATAGRTSLVLVTEGWRSFHAASSRCRIRSASSTLTRVSWP